MTGPDLGPSQQFAARLAGRMTLAEKAGQMAQPEKNSITPDEVAEFGIGSVLSGGGGNPDPNTPQGWAEMVGEFLAGARRSRLGIPVLYGTDAVHGHSNVHGATMFPHNVGLGATGDAGLIERVYRATARETAATGARWDFAPTVAVALDPRWGRTYESFGDDPELVAKLGAAAVRGLHGGDLSDPGAVLACLKHYVGDGGTAWGSVVRPEWTEWWTGWGPAWQIDQGDTRSDEATLRSVHLRPYADGIAAGALSVMASYSSWNGAKLHGHRYLLTDVLKGELGFPGFVVSDWMGVDQLHPDPRMAVVAALAAGIDMVMVPFEWRRFIANVVAAVESGDVPLERVDDAVRRILTVKHAMGLFADDGGEPPPVETVGSPGHRSLARDAAAASAVLLRNAGGILPLGPGPVAVAGAGADDVGLQCGGWTVAWQGGAGPITPGTTIVDGLREAGVEVVAEGRAPVGLAVVAESPYAEGIGDRADLVLSDDDVALVARLRERVDRLVLVVLSGRPLVLDEVAAQCDAIVAAWLPGSEGAGVADVLTGAVPFRGRLPRAWPGDGPSAGWERGHGLAS